jgi:N-acetyl-gamma-glutamyl-phosphate reductase
MKKLRIAIVGGTGYAGAELVRLLTGHPNADIVAVTSGRAAGERLSAHCPWLSTDIALSSFDAEKIDADVVFFAQESGFAMENAATVISNGAKVIDLSADFRLRDPAQYSRYYHREHSLPLPNFSTVYGLPELTPHEDIVNADLIANPGCYPTATLLALKPLFDAGLVEGTPVIDAKSGVSGAGRSRSETPYLFAERSGSMSAYAATGHRHIPEIEQSLGIPIRFTPHLIPTPRGMQITAHLPIKGSLERDDISHCYHKSYTNHKFVNICANNPEMKQVTASNRCDIGFEIDAHTGYLVVISVIDNLVKGAAGQAIQNMNIMFGLEESIGLPIHGVWP